MQKVFEKIIEKLEEYMDKNLVEHDSEQLQHCKDMGDCGMRDCVLCIFDKAIEIVKQEAEKFGRDTNVGSNGWIPCSERLPEEYGDYLVAWKPLHMSAEDIIKKVGRAVPHFYEIVEYDPDDEALWIGSIEQAQGEYEIIAWQPLPQPFQKGE